MYNLCYVHEIIGYACDGVKNCSTCHVILDKVVYDQAAPAADNDEKDLLGAAHGI